MTIEPERPTVSIMKACEVVGVTRRTIYNWINAGKVEYKRTAGGGVRIFTDSLWQHEPMSKAEAGSLSHQHGAHEWTREEASAAGKTGAARRA